MKQSLLFLASRSLRHHALSTAVTVISVGLASGLVMAVAVVAAQTHRAFTGGAVGYDAVLGARGSQLQLVLNAVYHLDTSPGNIPWSLYAQAASDPRVTLAIPYAVGDNFEGFRIVGTTGAIFTDLEYEVGRRLRVRGSGRPFDPARNEAVLGSIAARKTGLREGSTFHPIHGLVNDPSMAHDDTYIVTGVLEPTNTPSDRVIWIPIDGLYRLSGHVLRGAGAEFVPERDGAIPDEHKEVSAVLLKFRTPQVGVFFDQMINRQGAVATLAWPIGKSMAELFDKMGWVHRVLSLVAALVAIVAAGSILASLWNSMNERRREFAVLRALGARRRSVFGILVLEAGSIAALGSLIGFVIYFAILAFAAAIIREETGVVVDLSAFHPALVATPAAMTLLGAVAGVLPAMRAYRTDVARHLLPTT